jgi:hypothetical protein
MLFYLIVTLSGFFLTNVSPCFHEHLGFKKIGHFTQCGYKFGLWYDMIWMEKMIGEHVASHDTKSIHALAAGQKKE